MPPREHLPLLRMPRVEPRRKHGFGRPPERDHRAHGARIAEEVEETIAAARARAAIAGIDPKLILKVELTRAVDEDEWRRAGLHVLAQNPGNILVLFSDSFELDAFRERVERFTAGPVKGRENPPHTSLIAPIERVGELDPKDRIGPRLAASGIVDVDDIDGRNAFVVDVELWDAGEQFEREVRARSMIAYVEGELGGQSVGQPFVGTTGFSLIRLRIRGNELKALLDRPEVASIDLLPLPDLGEHDVPSVTIHDLPPAIPAERDAPIIGIIDSGLNAHPLLDSLVVEQIAIPAALGTADVWGHGTKVAGIAAYGDVRERLDQRSFVGSVRILSARVVNDQGAFDDETTVPAQMRSAVEALANAGCRVINLSLGDRRLTPYSGGRATPWTAELDALAREHDVVIVVSAGNARWPWGERNAEILASYPTYLTSADNRLIDPAIAANALTVGAIANANGLRDDPDDGVQVQLIAERNQPSPITRSGSGIGGAIKPDLVDYGGTVVFNGNVNRLLQGTHWPSAGVFTLNDDYRTSLFTAASGTSYAAPLVAYKAAQIVRRFPRASANLIRCLLALSAELPIEAVRCLQPNYEPGSKYAPSVRQCLGYGIADVARAVASDDNRAVLLADRQELDLDQVALYAVPLPEDFRQTRGMRQIRVSLAFDPPTRHTRLEYLGTRMNFYLVRGLSPDEIIDHFRKRDDGTRHPDIPDSAKCKMEPGVEARETSTLQCATFTQAVNRDNYGDTFYVAVFAQRRWAGDDVLRQRFSLAVELRHDNCQTLYQRCSDLILQLQGRLRVRVPA